MDEASKTRQFRGIDFARNYLTGTVCDIGCGDDLIVPHARAFDRIHGDANFITEHLPGEQFDCVHSSHCLEHMRDVPEAVRQWWALVRPGGVLIISVPDEDLYEQGVWPSLFNPDHKATFRLDREASWSPVSYDLRKLVASLPGANLIDAQRQDAGYDHKWRRSGISRAGRIVHFLGSVRKELFRRLRVSPRFDSYCDRLEWHLGKPIDQTLSSALAQIQVIVQKRVETLRETGGKS